MTEIVAIITLAVIVIAQAIERYFFGKHMTEQLGNSIKAVLSRNINDYIAATTTKPSEKQDFIENDQVDLDSISDEEFDNFIDKQNKS